MALGYSEDENGNVRLTMTREDYERLLLLMGYAVGWSHEHYGPFTPEGGLSLCNRLNAGNPRYTAYDIGEAER